MAHLMRALRRTTQLRRLLGTSLQLGTKDGEGKRLEGPAAAKADCATFMDQWKKDMAGIESRSRARREQQMLADPRTQSEVRRRSEFEGYLEWEMRKASEAWTKARSQGEASPPAEVRERKLLPKPGESSVSKRRRDFNGLLNHKLEKAKRDRDLVLDNLIQKCRDSPSECKRLERLRSFLDRRELEKVESLRKKYERKLISEEQRRREAARILKLTKRPHGKRK